MLTPKHIAALEARGLDVETVSRLGWSSVTKPKDGRDWILIPYYRDGVEVGKKYRVITKSPDRINFYQEKGSEQCLYNLDVFKALDPSVPIIITEGEMDCAVATQCGYVAVSVPNGAPDRPIEDNDSKKFDYLADIPDGNPIILAVDSDAPGCILRDELAKRIGRARCQWVRYPEGCKDLNETILKYGIKGVKEVFARAEWLRLEGVYSMAEIPPTPEQEIQPCGVAGMEDYYKVRLGDLTVITGIPSHGKTTLANEIACNLAWIGWNVCIGSFEQSPKPDHQKYLRTYHMNRPSHLEPEGSEAMQKADKWINEHFWFVIPDIDSEEFATVDWVLERCAMAVLRHGCKLVIIDPWNEMDHHRPQGMSLTEYTGWAIKQLKKFAKKYQVHVIVVAHPAKMEKNKDGGYAMPTLYDISDSANWYNKPDVGIIVYRNQFMLNVIRIAKVRYVGTIGQFGEVTLRYDNYKGQFLALTPAEIEAHIDAYRENNPPPIDGTKPYRKGRKKKEKDEDVAAQD